MKLSLRKFNTDDFSDLAIAMPDWDLDANNPNYGTVLLIDGSANGLVPSTARELLSALSI